MPLILLAILILFDWKLTLTSNQFTWLEDPDIANQVLPWYQFQAIQWHSHHIPAWDPNEWTGQPLFGQGQPGSAYPFNWILFLWPMKNAHINPVALNWYFVLIRYIGMLGCYALCRDLGRSRIASVLGACVFALGGFLANTIWPQMINGAVWAPLVFLFLFRAERGERPVTSSLLSGFFLGFAFLSGHHQAPIFIALAAIAMWLWIALRGVFSGNRQPDWRILRLAALSLAMAVLASAFQTLPMAEYGSRAVRWVGTPEPLSFDQSVPYYVHERYSPKPTLPLAVFMPGIAVEWWNPYVGAAALTLAILGAILAWRERQARWLAAIALFGFLFALGSSSLLHGVLYAILPMIDKTRNAGAAIIVFALGIAPLAAYGIDRISESPSSPWTRRAMWTLTGFGAIAGLVYGFFFAPNPVVTDHRMLITVLCTLGLAAILAALRANSISIRGGMLGALLIVLFELSMVSTYWFAEFGKDPGRDALLQNLDKHHDIARFLLDRADHGRIEFHDSDIPYNFGDYFGLETYQAYTASVTQNIWGHDVFNPSVRDIFGVRYSIAKVQERPTQQLVFTGASGLKVFENPGAYPRAWAVHESATVANMDQARDALASPDFHAREKVFFAGSQPGGAAQLAPCPASANDRVDIRSYGANALVISANLACPGMVIVSDTWYPGWRATVDGKPAPIEEAYGVFRAVATPAGEHTISMRYRPGIVLVGGWLSLAALFIAGFVYFRR